MTKVYIIDEVEIIRTERPLPGKFASLTEAYDACKGNDKPVIIRLLENDVEQWRLCQDDKKRDRWIKHVDGRSDEVVQIAEDGTRRIVRGK